MAGSIGEPEEPSRDVDDPAPVETDVDRDEGDRYVCRASVPLSPVTAAAGHMDVERGDRDLGDRNAGADEKR